MSQAGFDSAIPVFMLSKMVRALFRVDSVYYF
jgi:hypothetical protein